MGPVQAFPRDGQPWPGETPAHGFQRARHVLQLVRQECFEQEPVGVGTKPSPSAGPPSIPVVQRSLSDDHPQGGIEERLMGRQVGRQEPEQTIDRVSIGDGREPRPFVVCQIECVLE
jgi:hypothetical protein